MGLILRGFTPEVCQQLQSVPVITLTGLSQETNQVGVLPAGEYQVRFSENCYSKDGETRYFPSVAVYTPIGEKEYGAIDARSVRLPYASVCVAKITPDARGRTAQLEVIELLTMGQGRYPSERVSPQLVPITANPLSPLPQTTHTNAAETGITYASEALYQPTLYELRCWFVAARICQDQSLEERIQSLGTQLKEAAGIDLPPMEIRHPSVVLQPEEQAQMHHQIRPILHLWDKAQTSSTAEKSAWER
jgi:hypothetical protein